MLGNCNVLRHLAGIPRVLPQVSVDTVLKAAEVLVNREFWLTEYR